MTHYDAPSQPVKSEAKIQQEIVMWYQNNYCLAHHERRGIIFSVPNGGSRNKGEAVMLKATGLLSGVSDLIVMHRGPKSSHVLFIEVKKPGEKQFNEQHDFEHRVRSLGFYYFVVTSVYEFEAIIKNIESGVFW